MNGNRLPDNADHDAMKAPGDYYLVKDEQGIKLLWAILPNGFFSRLPARQLGEGDKENLVWGITENPDGTVTVDPSIETWSDQAAHDDPTLRTPENYWHGHLVNGEWTP